MKLPKFLLLPALSWAARLRFPTLFKITAVLFLITLVVPDPIPLIDEVILGLGALLFSRWKSSAVHPTPRVGRVYEHRSL